MKTWLAFAAAAAALAVGGGSGRAAEATADASPPVVKLKTNAFGYVLTTRRLQALYYWTPEKRSGRLKCFGACLRAWPPLLVRSARAVPRRVPGIRGVFGVVRRPSGKLQVTHNGVPIYTYAHEGPRQVLCNDVDGWFVVRA